MPQADDKRYPLTAAKPAPRGRRSISARDYSLPKPYRKKKFVEDEPELSMLRKGLLAFSGVVITSLVAALALLAKENFDSPPMLVIAAPKPAAPLPVALAEAPPPAFLAIQVTPRLPMPTVHVQENAPATPRPTARLARSAQSVPAPEAPPPDPDVVLISAILLLTAPSAATADDTCSVTAVSDTGCPTIHGMKP